MYNIILSYIISKYTINHIKSSNIIKRMKVIQSERKKERERGRIKNKEKKQTERVKEKKNEKNK